jgi:spoIIIJ-associated protein
VATTEARRPVDPRAVDAAADYLDEALERMGLDATVRTREEDGETVLEITGRDAASMVGKKGATLDALQLLCNRVASRELDGDRVSLTLDADGYRARRAKQLTTIAEQLGRRCVAEGKVLVMEPLPPRERRVIHMALARFPGVSTRSEGEGEERRIQIIPMPAPNP